MCPSDVDHLYREITEGVFYPVDTNQYIEGKKIVGYFYNEDEEEYLLFYNNEFFTDAEWRPISIDFLKVKANWEKDEIEKL